MLESSPVMVILRGLAPDVAVPAARALRAGGVDTLEVTTDSPGALETVRALDHDVPGLVVGMGTVRTPAQVAPAADAGARFLLSPHLDLAIVAETKQAGLRSVPGAFTPTEIHAAFVAGADLVKVFPLHVAGPDYLGALREPLPDIPLLACGGLDAEKARRCLAHGCVGVATGVGLIDGPALQARDWSRLTESTQTYLSRATGSDRPTPPPSER